MLPLVTEFGLFRLPEPSPGHIFFDLEAIHSLTAEGSSSCSAISMLMTTMRTLTLVTG